MASLFFAAAPVHTAAKSRDQSCSLAGESNEPVEFVLIEVSDVVGDVEMRTDFRTRPFRNGRCVMELILSVPFETPGNVRHR